VFDYDMALGGVWLDIDVARVSTVHKVKSHLSYEVACARGMGQWWQGNAFVDAMAQEAALQYSVPKAAAMEYSRRMRCAGSFLRDLAAALLKWGGGIHPRLQQGRTGQSSSSCPAAARL
jgi:hypothetical protein